MKFRGRWCSGIEKFEIIRKLPVKLSIESTTTLLLESSSLAFIQRID